MKISIAATNPCHLYPMALELARADRLGCYYSGYPGWKLPDSDQLDLRAHSLQTNVVYGLLKFIPERFRPSSRSLFLWQDQGFDRWVGAHLESCDFIHAMPGQCLEIFRAARRLGIRTVLNHATGPIREWVRIMNPEYARVGLKLEAVCPYDEAYFRREAEEYALSDFHCAASSVVREQLIACGIPADRIWIVPYGADPTIFRSLPEASAPSEFRIVFAGQIGLRKGLQTLLDALTAGAHADWQMHFYGAKLSEADHDLAAYKGATPLTFHGPVSQNELATAFRSASVLVLPSLEEGFGLVVPQALSCGLPAIVSDRVGAKDLLRHRENGSVFATANAETLLAELEWWRCHPQRVAESFTWKQPAETLIQYSQTALS
ncbi:MAG TPA: glycosyltransferase family 4 protein [Chthoniobacteraceae bacterium]|jgi:glycosyltransferase involved in cell wall biosynthesis